MLFFLLQFQEIREVIARYDTLTATHQVCNIWKNLAMLLNNQLQATQWALEVCHQGLMCWAK